MIMSSTMCHGTRWMYDSDFLPSAWCWRSSVDANVLVRSHARPQSELITDLPAPHVRSPVALTYTAHSLAGASVFSPRLKHLYVPLCFLCVPLLTVICSVVL